MRINQWHRVALFMNLIYYIFYTITLNPSIYSYLSNRTLEMNDHIILLAFLEKSVQCEVVNEIQHGMLLLFHSLVVFICPMLTTSTQHTYEKNHNVKINAQCCFAVSAFSKEVAEQ